MIHLFWKVVMSQQDIGLEEILILGASPASAQLAQAFKAQGFNTRVMAVEDDWSQLSPQTIKAVVVCKPETTQAAIALTQRLSQLHLGPIWTVLNVNQPHDVYTQGTYHPSTLVKEVAAALSAPQALDAQHTLARVYAPVALVGQRLDAAYLQTYQGVTLLGIHRMGQSCASPEPDALIEQGDCYVVSGANARITSFTHTPLRLVAGAASWA